MARPEFRGGFLRDPDSGALVITSDQRRDSGTPRGRWTPFTVYLEDDLVTEPDENGALYFCLEGHTSAAVFATDFTLGGVSNKWELLQDVQPTPPPPSTQILVGEDEPSQDLPSGTIYYRVDADDNFLGVYIGREV